ncbi:hypothetical protein ACOSQ2_022569 [Xanthoceras sorbifolium]
MLTRAKCGVFKPKVYATQSIVSDVDAEPKNVKKASQNSHWFNAMQLEFNDLLSNHTWSLVPYKPQINIVGNKWVFQRKFNQDGSLQKYKAPFVAKNFHQTPGVDFFETFSQVVKASTIRVILALAVNKDFDIQQLDVNNAFPNGDLQEVVYMTTRRLY